MTIGSKPLIEVHSLRKVYDTQVALEGLSFEVRPGEIMGFVGPNGAGKTTTLRMLAGILPCTSGSITVAGVSMASDPVEAKRRLGFVPDTPHLMSYLTVWEHLQFVGRVHELEDRDPRARGILEELELYDRKDHLPDTLSRGMRQKVAIAWAFISSPSVYLLDEPLTGLDPHGIRTVKTAIRKRAEQGAGVIISSHLLELIEVLCDSILIISKGQMRARGSIEELKKQIKPDSPLEDLFFQITGADGSTPA